MFVRQVVASKLTEAKQAAVTRHGIETHAAAEFLEKFVVGMGHRVGEIHVLAAADFEHGVAGNYIFLQSGQRDGRLDGGTRNSPVRVSELLIYDGENAASVGIDGDDGSVVAAKSFDCGGADNGIVAGRDVANRRIDALFRAKVAVMTRTASGFRSRLRGGRGVGRQRGNATSSEEHCQSGFSQPGGCNHSPCAPDSKTLASEPRFLLHQTHLCKNKLRSGLQRVEKSDLRLQRRARLHRG